jgi:uncharacterized membrane protein YjjP (DUF1212 family)
MSPANGSRVTASAEDVALLSTCARLLFENGETTRWTVREVERLGEALGFRAALFPRWGELNVRIEDAAGARYEIVASAPLGVDMRKVTATVDTVDRLHDGRIDAVTARASVDASAKLPPISLFRYAVMAGVGAAALGVIFGAEHLLTLILIAGCAGAGACLRRCLAGISVNPFIQPFCAALLAGAVGAASARLDFSSPLRLVAICPCMILVPGPHLLNGMIDLTRARIALGAARVGYAGIIVLAICAGLILGLSLGGVDLPVSGPAPAVPLGYDVLAAGIAVAAYGTFFAMPWRMLPIPILIGMTAHASRWALIALMGSSVETGALVACLIVGAVMTPITDKLRLPFAAFAFASVVSLIPGVYLFRMAGGLVQLISLGRAAPFDLLLGTVVDGATALLITLVMTFGLIVPRMCIDYFYPPYAEAAATRRS